jgi:elongation factor G
MTAQRGIGLLSIAVTPRTALDRDRLARGLDAIMSEDPTIRHHHDAATGISVIAGMGELHLEVVLDRLRREFNVEASVDPPRVEYQERLTSPADGEMKYSAVAGNRMQYAHVRVHVYPGGPGSGYVFENELLGDAIPTGFVLPVREGIRVSLSRGVLAGYPIDDVRAVLYDGSYHQIDSSNEAFEVAGFGALYDAAKKARPVLVEPVMWVDVTVDEAYVEDVVTDLAARRARILFQQNAGGMRKIEAHAPLAQIFGYATNLRQRSFGRGAFAMRFAHYQPCDPPHGEKPADDALVGAPLKPLRPLRDLRIALSEPVVDDDLGWSNT